MRLSGVLAAVRRKLPANYHNVPKRTVDKHTLFIDQRAPREPQFERKILRYKTRAYYDKWRPWEEEFKQLNARFTKTRQVFVEPIRDWTYFRGDRVEVIKGPDKGKQGLIGYIVKERNWVFVQGLNLKREYVARVKDKVGVIQPEEEPYLINQEVKLVDPSDLMPTDVEWRYDDNGDRVRVSVRTDRVIPLPTQAFETMDYVKAENYYEQPKDTNGDEVTKVTFKPQAKTFEMDICDQMGITEERVPYPFYWY